MRPRIDIKICGLRDRETVDAAVDAGADMVGFMFVQRSPRHIDLDAAAELARILPPSVSSVAVTVDADDALIERICAVVRPDWIQAHGNETPERIAAVAATTGKPVMKALPVARPEDVHAAGAYAGAAARILFDAKPPKDATRQGGLGVAFDWTLLSGYTGEIPWMLSGGLSADNVREAIRTTGASAVDVSSGVERELGVKDPLLIRAFITAVLAPDEPLSVRA